VGIAYISLPLEGLGADMFIFSTSVGKKFTFPSPLLGRGRKRLPLSEGYPLLKLYYSSLQIN
jgi:hypothetical protein